jgi:hypothetical protein
VIINIEKHEYYGQGIEPRKQTVIKSLDFCCVPMSEEYNHFQFIEDGSVLYDNSMSLYLTNINFCPFCGATIIFKENK